MSTPSTRSTSRRSTTCSSRCARTGCRGAYAGSRSGTPGAGGGDDTIPVELAGVTRLVQRSEVAFVEAQGDYARLHTAEGSHLVRLSLAALEERWADAGFVRIHRSLLVALGRVDEVRTEAGRCTVVIGDVELTVSRRLTPVLRDRLRRVRAGEA